MAHNSNDFLDDDRNPHVIPVTRSNFKYLESYHDLGLSKELLQALLDDLSLRNPCRIHSIILPLITSKPHQSLCAQARPGFEKHTCYVLGILDRIDLNRHDIPQAIVLCPTLQLAQQIHKTVLSVGNYMAVTCQVVEAVLPDMPVLNSNIVIGLPSTIFSLTLTKKLIVSDVKMVVIDIADHLLQLLGERSSTQYVMQAVNSDCQVLLFYSTLTDQLRDYIPTILPDWKWNRVFLNQEEVSVYQSTMYQHVFKNEEEKAIGIKDVLIRVEEMQAVIYVNQGADFGILCEALRRIKNLVIAPELGGQADAIIRFKRGEARVLITCNPIYFGFDLSKVNLVFFFHLPVDDKGVVDLQKYYRVATWGGRYLNKACVFHMLSDDKSCDDEIKSQRELMQKIESHFGRVAKCVGVGPFRYLAALREGFIDHKWLPLREENYCEDDDDEANVDGMLVE